MKTKIKKFFKSAVLMLGVMVFTFGISGCSFFKFLDDFDKLSHKYYDFIEERDSGDFMVRFYEDRCEILGTSEQGNSKKYLVVPEYIEGLVVENFGYSDFTPIFADDNGLGCPEIKSEALEKIYFENAIYSHPYPFRECPNLKKVIYPGIEKHSTKIDDCPVYYPREVYERCEYKGTPWHPRRPANVTFNYNYEDAPKDGYYWIDDCDYGGKIEFVPKAPEREGYGFVGWYKEAECINEWDFDVDTLPEAIAEQGEQNSDSETQIIERPIYQETVLYAKWIKN